MKESIKVIICPFCGNELSVNDRYFCGDDDIKVSCDSCGFIEWFKDTEDVYEFFLVCEKLVEVPCLHERTAAWRRYKDYTKAARKRDIARKVYPSFKGESEYYSNLHQYSKNKIHCSCPICSAKTRNKGRRNRKGNYAPSINYKISELKRQIAMNESELEYRAGED